MPALIVQFLYAICITLFGGLIVFIAYHGWRSKSSTSARLRRIFFLLALSLLVWQVTFLSEAYASLRYVYISALYLGRANFAAIVFTVYLALRFVQAIGQYSLSAGMTRLCLVETCSIAAITLLTPLVDADELIDTATGRPTSCFGVLFPLYLLHVVAYLTATLVLVVRSHRRVRLPAIRQQLNLIGIGICATGGVALITNALLPYAFGDFRFCDGGTLATLFFVLAAAYAVFVHGLFDLRVVIRKTVVYGILLAFILGGYSSAAFIVTEYLTKGSDRLTEFTVLLIAFSVDPLRRWLEKKVDRLLFDREKR